MCQQSVKVPAKHPCEVIAAPVNAQITEIQSVKQLKSPRLPSCTQLKAVAPMAQSGAITQNMANCVCLLAPHQQTMSNPRLRLAAAITQPRQKAKTFLVAYVQKLKDFSGRSPRAYQVFKIHGIKAMRMNEQANIAGSLPILNMRIQRVLRMLENVKNKCTVLVHQFFTKLYMLTMAKAVQITAQIEKNSPGGVTNKWYLSDIQPVLRPIKQLTMRVATKVKKLPIRMGHIHLPYGRPTISMGSSYEDNGYLPQVCSISIQFYVYKIDPKIDHTNHICYNSIINKKEIIKDFNQSDKIHHCNLTHSINRFITIISSQQFWDLSQIQSSSSLPSFIMVMPLTITHHSKMAKSQNFGYSHCLIEIEKLTRFINKEISQVIFVRPAQPY